jgi:hypothetical protein
VAKAAATAGKAWGLVQLSSMPTMISTITRKVNHFISW